MRVGQIVRIDSPRAQVVGQPQIQEKVEPIAGRYLNRVGTDAEQLVHARQLMQRRFPGFLTLLWLHRRSMTVYECCVQYTVRPGNDPLPRNRTPDNFRRRDGSLDGWVLDGWVGVVEATIPPPPPGTFRKRISFSLERVMDFIADDSIDTNDSEILMMALGPLIAQYDSDFITAEHCQTNRDTLVVAVTYLARVPAIADGGVITPSLTLSTPRAPRIGGFGSAPVLPGSGNLIVTSNGIQHDLGTVQDFQIRHDDEKQQLNSLITTPKENKANRITLQDETDAPRPNRADLLADD